MAVTFTLSGSTSRTHAFLRRVQSTAFYRSAIERLAQRGVAALQAATPTDTGLTASSWSYEIVDEGGALTVYWLNSHVEDGVNIAVILQYGHGTGTGGYVTGRDYINPAIQPIMDEIADGIWKVVTSA